MAKMFEYFVFTISFPIFCEFLDCLQQPKMSSIAMIDFVFTQKICISSYHAYVMKILQINGHHCFLGLYMLYLGKLTAVPMKKTTMFDHVDDQYNLNYVFMTKG